MTPVNGFIDVLLRNSVVRSNYAWGTWLVVTLILILERGVCGQHKHGDDWVIIGRSFVNALMLHFFGT